MARLRIGTCSWKYPSWEGLVYSTSKGINYLEEYAQQYDTVEVDQWFWSLFGKETIRLPKSKDAEDYSLSVPNDFRFTVKVPNSITLTHLYQKNKNALLETNEKFFSPSLFNDFLMLLNPLGSKLGPLIFQFEYLNKNKMPSQKVFYSLFRDFRDQIPRDYQYAVEVRNPNYLNKSFFTFLENNSLIPVLIDGYWMPSIIDIYKKWKSWMSGQKVIIIRLLGSDRKKIEKETEKKWNNRVASQEGKILRIVDMVQELLSDGKDVYLNINNHYEGSAPLTIRRVKELLKE